MNLTIYEISIKKRLHKDDSYTLVTSIVFLNRYVNYPASIDLSEDQKFEYKDNKKFLSPYHVR